MLFNLTLAIAFAAIFAAGLMIAFWPRTYDKYILRDMGRPSRPLSSGVVAVLILVVMVLVAVHLGLHLLRRPAIQTPTVRYADTMHLETWAGLIFVAITGIILCLFPVAATALLLRKKIAPSPEDTEAATKIKMFSRAMGVVFLIGAVLIARQLL